MLRIFKQLWLVEGIMHFALWVIAVCGIGVLVLLVIAIIQVNKDEDDKNK